MNTFRQFIIETPRLWLVNCDRELLRQLFQGDEALAAYLDVHVPEKWTEFGEPAFRWTDNALAKQPEAQPWYSYLSVLKAENKLIGSCGFTGPAREGRVEIGYEIAEIHRGQGLATEVVQALVRFAFSFPHMAAVRAHTLPEKNASNTILQKVGFTYIGDATDPEEGTVWRWEMPRQTE
jgi:[ribosomal protein S5]-alanine N-acetyltransferase